MQPIAYLVFTPFYDSLKLSGIFGAGEEKRAWRWARIESGAKIRPVYTEEALATYEIGQRIV